MDQESDSSGSEEYYDLDDDVGLNTDHVSRFLAMLDDDTNGHVRAQELHDKFSNSSGSPANEASGFRVTTTLHRPSYFQELTESSLSRQHHSESSETKTVKYVSEVHINLSPKPYSELPTTRENQSVHNQHKAESQAHELGKVEYVSAIHVTRSESSGQQKHVPLAGDNQEFQRENAIAKLTSFLSKVSQETSSSISKTPRRHVFPASSSALRPSANPLSSIYHDATDLESTRKLPSDTPQDQDLVCTASLPNKPMSMSENNGNALAGVGNNEGFIPITSPASRPSTIKEMMSSSPKTLPPKEILLSPEIKLLPPLPDADKPPPLPKVPPPVLLSGPAVQSLTSDETDLITAYLKSLRMGEAESSKDDQIQVIPKNDDPIPTESILKRRQKAADSSVKQLAIPKAVSTSFVSKQAPRLCISPGLPKWPPEPVSPTSSPTEPSKERYSDSSSNDTERADAPEVELRKQGGRGNTKDIQGTSSEDKSTSATASWDTGYSGSNTSSLISCEPLEDERVTTVSDEEEEVEKRKKSQSARPARTSIVQILRTNSTIGRKSYPRWQNSVPSDAALEGLSEKRVQLLELEFEIITTEAEYFSRMKFLLENFIVDEASYNTKAALKSDSKKNIFLDLEDVCSRSEKLVEELDECWKKSVYLEGIFDIIREHSRANFNALINYCAGYEDVVEKILIHRKQDRKLEKIIIGLEEGKPDLREQLREPMGRIMQLQLLLKNCCQVVEKLIQTEDTPHLQREYETAKEAMASVTQLCFKVDEVTGLARRMQKIFEIQNTLEFPSEMTPLSLTSQSRWLVKKGSLTQIGSLVFNNSKVSFKKSGTVVTVFLFNDLIIMAKKKSEVCHVVRDYGLRPGVIMKEIQGVEGLPSRLAVDSPGYYPIFVSISKNSSDNTAYVFLSCAEKSERSDWLEAMDKTSDEFHGL